MTDTRRMPTLARIRGRLAASAAEPVAEPPMREHLFGSQYRVLLPFEQLMRTRGYTGEQVVRGLRLVEASDAERQRDAATERAGYAPGEVVWPSA